jgi:hypothetical protein
MKDFRSPLLIAAFLGVSLSTQLPAQQPTDQAPQVKYLKALAALHPIDAHAHVWKNDPIFNAMLEPLDLHIINILYIDDTEAEMLPLDKQRAVALSFVRSVRGRASLCTTFDPFKFFDPNFAQNAIDALNKDFADGAIAVKVWKNIGMEIKDKNGRYVTVDDPRLEPIYRDIEAHHRTLIAHQAEPDIAWSPSPDPNALSGAYYAKHPEWNMAKIPGALPKLEILKTRDHLLSENPHLRVVGAHIGSMENDLDMVAATLDRHPNFAVDTGGRVAFFTIQPSAKVRAFLMKYQDRVAYGTDLYFQGDETGTTAVEQWKSRLALDWRYFATDDTFEYRGHTVHGLNLPPAVLKKIFHSNAVHWFPGVISTKPTT